jgi:hypothetical protein
MELRRLRALRATQKVHLKPQSKDISADNCREEDDKDRHTELRKAVGEIGGTRIGGELTS